MTPSVQLAFIARVETQVLLTIAKSARPVPVIPMFEMFNVAVPVFFRVTLVAVVVVLTVWFPKPMLVGVNITAGVPADVPVPMRLMTWVAAVALLLLSVKVSVAESLPDCVGEKLMVSVQVALGAIVAAKDVLLIEGQAVLPVVFRLKFVVEDKLGFVPEVGTEIVSGVLPTFVTTKVCGLSLLVELTAVDAKFNVGAAVEIPILITRLLPVSAM